METIRKNIEDERLKSLLMGFGMGIGFGMRLYEVIETPKKQTDITQSKIGKYLYRLLYLF